MTPKPVAFEWYHLTRGQLALAAALGIFGLAVFLGTHGKDLLRLLPKLRFGGFHRKGQSAISVGPLRIPDEARLRHTHVVGATGSGKTVLIEELIKQDLLRGHGALIVDPKGDRAFFERIRAFCARIGRLEDLHLLSATHRTESARWNPCRLGDVSELQTKFFQAGVYEHPFYAKACELAYLRAFEALVAESPGGFTLTELSQKFDGLSQGGRDETLKGMYFDLSNLARGEWSELLGAAPSPAPEISLLEVTRKNEILFVDLPTEAKGVQSQRIGRLLLQEIILLSGMRKAYPAIRSEKPFSVFIDEFDAFASESFVTFLNKGRSSDFMIHLAHQTLSDLTRVSPPFSGQIMGNTNVRFVFRQDDPEDAETWARFFGTRQTIKSTFQTQDGSHTGAASNRETQEFRISPGLIKDLPIGECVASCKTEGLLEKIRIPYPSPWEQKTYRLPIFRGETRNERKSLPATTNAYEGLKT